MFPTFTPCLQDRDHSHFAIWKHGKKTHLSGDQNNDWLFLMRDGPCAEYLRIVMAHSSSSYHWKNIAVRVRTLLTFSLQLSNENGLTLVGVLLVFYACCTFFTACLSCQKCAVKCFQQAAVSGQFVDVRKAPCPDSCMLQ